MNLNSYGIFLAIAIVCAIFARFVWPTPYQHFTLYSDPPRSVRVDRFTGRTELLGVNGWYSVADRRRAAADTIRMFDSLTARR